MKQILIFLIGSIPFLSYGQVDKFQRSDKLFKFYKAPVIEKNVYERLEKDDAIIYIGCYYTTDTAGKITSEKYVPLPDIGNVYELTDSIWKSAITTISIGSKSWVFNPILWDFKGDKKAESEVNKKTFQRPFKGRPRYFVIAEISGIRNGSSIDKISFLKDYNFVTQ